MRGRGITEMRCEYWGKNMQRNKSTYARPPRDNRISFPMSSLVAAAVALLLCGFTASPREGIQRHYAGPGHGRQAAAPPDSIPSATFSRDKTADFKTAKKNAPWLGKIKSVTEIEPGRIRVKPVLWIRAARTVARRPGARSPSANRLSHFSAQNTSRSWKMTVLTSSCSDTLQYLGVLALRSDRRTRSCMPGMLKRWSGDVWLGWAFLLLCLTLVSTFVAFAIGFVHDPDDNPGSSTARIPERQWVMAVSMLIPAMLRLRPLSRFLPGRGSRPES